MQEKTYRYWGHGTMAEMKENKVLEDIILEYLPRFNESVKTYLKDNLKTMGDDRIAERINIHMAFCSEEKSHGIGEEMIPFAIKYNNRQAEKIKKDISEDIKKDSWWIEHAGLKKESELRILLLSVHNSQDDNMLSGVQMILVVELEDKKYQREMYFMEVLVDILEGSITDIRDLVDINSWLNKLNRDNIISLMERYVKKVFQKWEEYPGLSREECCRLSYEKNEGRECLARIYLGKKSGYQKKVSGQKGIICFQNTWNHIDKTGLTSKEVEDGRIRYFSKMMELCKDDKYLLTWFDEGKNNTIDLFGVADQKWLMKNQYNRYISFEGYGEWNLNESGETVLLYTKGNYYFSRQSMEKTWEIELKDKGVTEEKNLEKFKQITGKLAEQEHGTCMIVLEKDDITGAVKHLCEDCSRGTQIYGTLNLEKENLDFLKGLTSLDGALLVDKDGKCHAFGVILDGEAKKPGNPAKGARHNSALTYINANSGRCAVVVSEDKTVMIRKSEDIDKIN